MDCKHPRGSAVDIFAMAFVRVRVVSVLCARSRTITDAVDSERSRVHSRSVAEADRRERQERYVLDSPFGALSLLK